MHITYFKRAGISIPDTMPQRDTVSLAEFFKHVNPSEQDKQGILFKLMGGTYSFSKQQLEELRDAGMDMTRLAIFSAQQGNKAILKFSFDNGAEFDQVLAAVRHFAETAPNKIIPETAFLTRKTPSDMYQAVLYYGIDHNLTVYTNPEPTC